MTIGTTEGRTLVREEWKAAEFDWTSGSLDYKGLSTTHKASASVGDLWYIWKFTWSSGNPTKIEGPLNGNWNDRATLDWT